MSQSWPLPRKELSIRPEKNRTEPARAETRGLNRSLNEAAAQTAHDERGDNGGGKHGDALGAPAVSIDDRLLEHAPYVDDADTEHGETAGDDARKTCALMIHIHIFPAFGLFFVSRHYYTGFRRENKRGITTGCCM